MDQPVPTDITSVHGFLGTCGLVWIFIKDFAKHACPLVNLMHKDITFHFRAEEITAMDIIKNLIINFPVLHHIILAVGSSTIAIRYVLMQVHNDKHWYPSRFGSITQMEHKSWHSKVKLKLYGLFHTLCAYHISIIGVKNLVVVEVDTKYLKGMLNNLDIQPNVNINWWIASILLFDFKLIHIPIIHHTAVMSHIILTPETLLTNQHPLCYTATTVFTTAATFS
jgi:hypothetical protein